MKTDTERTKKWRIIIDDFKKTNVTMKQYCELNDLKIHQLIYWKRKFKQKEEKSNQETSFIKVLPVIETAPIYREISIEVNKIKINIPNEFNPNHLMRILKVVNSVD